MIFLKRSREKIRFLSELKEKNLNTNQKTICGGVAQLGEHLLCKQGVRSSILLISTTPAKVNPAQSEMGS